MKLILTALVLFMLTNPVLAKPVNNTSECLHMYGTYMDAYGDSQLIPKEQMYDFIYKCLPTTYFDTPEEDNEQPQELLQINGDSETIKTIKV